jgi:hypothetical protein
MDAIDSSNSPASYKETDEVVTRHQIFSHLAKLPGTSSELIK